MPFSFGFKHVLQSCLNGALTKKNLLWWLKKNTLMQQTAAVKDHIFCAFQKVISVLLWKYLSTWKFSVHYPPYYLQKSGKRCNFHFTAEDREEERGLLASWSLSHMKWENKGRLTDLRIKIELLRVKARCSQKVKITKKLPLQRKSDIQVRNSKIWHKTSHTSLTLETAGKQNNYLHDYKWYFRVSNALRRKFGANNHLSASVPCIYLQAS